MRSRLAFRQLIQAARERIVLRSRSIPAFSRGLKETSAVACIGIIFTACVLVSVGLDVARAQTNWRQGILSLDRALEVHHHRPGPHDWPGPSFNCRGATSQSAQAVCNNPNLSHLDLVMGALYKQLIETQPDQQASLHESQHAWLQEREQTCGRNVGCLQQVYQTRIKELRLREQPTQQTAATETKRSAGVFLKPSAYVDQSDYYKIAQSNCYRFLFTEQSDRMKQLGTLYVGVGASCDSGPEEYFLASRASPGVPFVYRHNGCTLLLQPEVAENTLVVLSGGNCVGKDAPIANIKSIYLNDDNGRQQAAKGPSFNCRQASASSDKAVCANRELSDLDRIVAKLYSETLALPLAQDIRTAQRQWISQRNQCGASVECLQRLYKRRIDELKGAAVTAQLNLMPALANAYNQMQRESQASAGSGTQPYASLTAEAGSPPTPTAPPNLPLASSSTETAKATVAAPPLVVAPATPPRPQPSAAESGTPAAAPPSGTPSAAPSAPSTPAAIESTTPSATAQGVASLPDTPQPFTRLNQALLLLRDHPEFVSDAQWVEMTAQQIESEQRYATGIDQFQGNMSPRVMDPKAPVFVFEWQTLEKERPDLANGPLLNAFVDDDWSFLSKEKGYDSRFAHIVGAFVFSRERIHGRQPEFAAHDLVSVFKQFTLAAAAEAPNYVEITHTLPDVAYDFNAKAFRFKNEHESGGFLDQIELLKVQTEKDLNRGADHPHLYLYSDASENASKEPNNPGVSINYQRPEVSWRNDISTLIGGLDLAFDKKLVLRQIPISESSAERLTRKLGGMGSGLKVHITFRIGSTTLQHFSSSGHSVFICPATLTGATITGPNGNVIERLTPSDFVSQVQPLATKSETAPKTKPTSAQAKSPGSATPANGGPDILGITLGMSFAEAEKIIRQNMDVGLVMIGKRKWQARAIPDDIKPYTSGRMFISRDGTQTVTIYDEPPARPDVVLGVTRRARIPKPLVAAAGAKAAIEAKLANKYGGKTQKWVEPRIEVWTAAPPTGNLVGLLGDGCNIEKEGGSSLDDWHPAKNSQTNPSDLKIVAAVQEAPSLSGNLSSGLRPDLTYASKSVPPAVWLCRTGVAASVHLLNDADVDTWLFDDRQYARAFLASKAILANKAAKTGNAPNLGIKF